jgi:hypothetical protein
MDGSAALVNIINGGTQASSATHCNIDEEDEGEDGEIRGGVRG